MIAAVMGTRTTAQWVEALEAAAVPCGPINRLDEVFADEQVKARGLEMALTRADGTVTPSVASPIRLSATPVEYARAAPALGADTDAVLGEWLGLSTDAIAALKSRGIAG